MINIGQVLYHGKEATDEQKKMSPEDIGLLFQDDVANAIYSYSTPMEDLAMLFEATMMRYHYKFELDIALIDRPTEGKSQTYR